MILSTASLSAVTAKPSIIEDIDFLLGTDSTSYPLADKLRNINAHYYDVVTLILENQSNWEWDDTTKTDFPIGTTNLVADQKDYALPTDLIKLLRVEVKNSGGTWVKLQQFDETQVGDKGLASFYSTSGMPMGYREVGNSIELYPAASSTSTTLTAGLKIYSQRLPDLFTTSDATESPGFDARFHRILSYGAAYDYAVAKSLPQMNGLLAKMNELKNGLAESYASRNREVRPGIKARRYSYN